MSPLYAQCPFCEFPVVVNGAEPVVPRHCRQCRGRYTPGAAVRSSVESKAGRRQALAEGQKAALRAQLRGRRRAGG